MNYRDVSMVDNSLDQLGDTLLKQRMMKAEQGRYDQEQQRLQQNATAEQDYRKQMLEDKVSKDAWERDPANPLNQQRTAAAAKDTAQAGNVGNNFKVKGYFYDPIAGKTIGFEGNPASLDQYAASYKQQHGNDLQILAEPPNSLTGKKEIGSITVGGNKHIFYSGDEAMYQEAQAKYDAAKQAAADKGIDINTGKPLAGTTQTIESEIPAAEEKPADVTPASGGSWNPLHWGEGAHPAITNAPAIPSTPKRIIKQTVPVGAAPPLAPGLPNLAPQAAPTPAATVKKPTRAQAADYVQKFGANAKAKLQADGFNITGYAD